MAGVLPFLDLQIIRDEEGNIHFDVYRKPTHTNRFITADSFHHHSHKHAAFNSMIHRLVNLPLSTERFTKEWQYIIKTADMNGYSERCMRNLLNRHKHKSLVHNSTSLPPEREQKRRIAVEFHPFVTPKLEKICHQQNIQIIPTSNSSKLKTSLRSTKDKTDTFDKAGVYEMCCPYDGCTAMYIGETSRALGVRANEHINSIKRRKIEASAIAEHAYESGHTHIQKENFRLLSATDDKRRLRVIECIHIHKNQDRLMNRDNGFIAYSSLIDLL